LRVVLDTNTVLSALLFPKGRLLWLREVWRAGRIIPVVNRATVQELIRVLAYPKFKLSQEEIETALNAYLPYAEMVTVPPEDMSDIPACRDENDQMFVSLAAASKADVLVSGDQAILELAGQAPFSIETPAQFKRRFLPED
jgi:uncharacterized protein